LKNYSPDRARTTRDVLLVRIDADRLLAVTCDSAGAVGSKPQDEIKASPELVGKLTTRVALMELLSIGADPIAISGTFSAEPKPTGDLLIRGIREEVRNARIGELRIVCSSEKNFKVKQTGIGITAIGLISKSQVKIGRCQGGDEVIAVGEPAVGREVIRAEKKRSIANTLDVLRLRKKPFVHELIPVGSKGILHETNVMAKGSGLVFEASVPGHGSFEKSAGPATVLLLALAPGHFTGVKRVVGLKPAREIGALRKR
jgi:selenophosphate synthetase-related protein